MAHKKVTNAMDIHGYPTALWECHGRCIDEFLFMRRTLAIIDEVLVRLAGVSTIAPGVSLNYRISTITGPPCNLRDPYSHPLARPTSHHHDPLAVFHHSCGFRGEMFTSCLGNQKISYSLK